MNHFSRGDNGSPSSDIRLDKGQFMGAITELLANSKWEYLLGSPDWEKQLDMLFNKVRDKGVIYLLEITPYHYLLQNQLHIIEQTRRYVMNLLLFKPVTFYCSTG